MADVLIPRPRGPARGRPFAKGQSGHSAGRPAGARNKKTLAAAVLLDGEAEALTRRAGIRRRPDGNAALYRTHPGRAASARSSSRCRRSRVPPTSPLR